MYFDNCITINFKRGIFSEDIVYAWYKSRKPTKILEHFQYKVQNILFQ